MIFHIKVDTIPVFNQKSLNIQLLSAYYVQLSAIISENK